MSKKILWLLGLVAIFNLFVFHAFGSTGFVIAALTLYIFVLGVFAKRFPVWPTIFIGLLCLAMIRSANGLINFLDGLAILITIFWTGYALIIKRSFFGAGEFILTPMILAQSYILSIFDIFNAPKPKTSLIPWFRGLILGLPIFLLVLALLTSDPVYGRFINDILKNIRRLITHIIFTMILLGVFLPYTYLKLRELPKKIYDWTLPVATEVNIIVGLVALALGSFLIVQWPYVFAKAWPLMNYSEYVNQGFGEFLLVALIVYGLAWVSLWVKNVFGPLKILLFGEFAVFVISIFRRVALYQEYHGWTLARIYGGLFLIWVSGLMVILVWRHFSQKNLLKAEIIFTAGVIIVFSYFNAEKFVSPTVNNRIDYVYLSRLSADGVNNWDKALNYAGQILSKEYPGIINREQRREINYANFILNSLANNYASINDHNQKTAMLDKLFLYNYSEKRAWKNEPGQKIEELKNSYKKLNDRIQKQPENERDWDFDISLNSPFL